MKAPAALALVLASSAVLLGVRLYAAPRIGFGDAEALYASYALFPSPVYVDHPGLVGLLARAVGGGAVPSPLAAHRATALLATLAPAAAAWAARALGASGVGAALAALALLAAPEVAVGLFGLTPDLLLLPLWYLALGAAATSLRSPAGSPRALVGALAAAAAAGLACDAKASGALLALALVLAWGSRAARPHLRTLAPWAALALLAVLVWPVAQDELRRGLPMLRHRLVSTQTQAGFSLRNVAALLGGQLAYVGPPQLVAAALLARDLWRHPRRDLAATLLRASTLACAPLVLLALWSRVAEPHWVAPLYLALPLWLALRADDAQPALALGLARASLATGAVLSSAAIAWTLAPIGPRLLGPSAALRFDLATDLYAWDDGLALVRDELARTAATGGPPPVVVGSHWIVAAQLRAGLDRAVLVGCAGDACADFDDWLPARTWRSAPLVLFVSDDRFDVDPARALADRVAETVSHVSVRRGGVTARRITVARLVSAGRG